MWLVVPQMFEGTPQQDGALAAFLAAILAGESVRFAGRLRIEVERAQHGVLRPWDASDPFGFALPGFGCRRDLLSDDLRALATRWLGMDQDAPSSWLELCPNRGRRGRTEDQRLDSPSRGTVRPGPEKATFRSPRRSFDGFSSDQRLRTGSDVERPR